MLPPRRAAKIPPRARSAGCWSCSRDPGRSTFFVVLSHNGKMQFGVLRRQVEGISARVLTERLRTLEGAGFFFRHYEQTIPPAVTYGITDRMKDIEKVLAQIEELSRKWHGHGTTVGADRETTATGADA